MLNQQIPSKEYEKVFERFSSYLSTYLYSSISNKRNNLPPKIISNIHEKKECTGIRHQHHRVEERYGHAVMIFELCWICGRGYAEVNPPRRYTRPRKEVVANG